jgi:hypothetical protein
MDQDSITYDSLADRPLPKWLTDRRDGLNTVKPVIKEIKEDRSLDISLVLTVTIILIVITIVTIFILRKKKNDSI